MQFRMQRFLVLVGGFYGMCRCTRSISPEKKMYFLKREPLHHGKWKLLDIMKNNSRARARERYEARDGCKKREIFSGPFS